MFLSFYLLSVNADIYQYGFKTCFTTFFSIFLLNCTFIRCLLFRTVIYTKSNPVFQLIFYFFKIFL